MNLKKLKKAALCFWLKCKKIIKNSQNLPNFEICCKISKFWLIFPRNVWALKRLKVAYIGVHDLLDSFHIYKQLLVYYVTIKRTITYWIFGFSKYNFLIKFSENWQKSLKKNFISRWNVIQNWHMFQIESSIDNSI